MEKHRKDSQRKILMQKRNVWIIRLFYSGLFVLFVLGLLIPLRPKVSEVEKRELEKFPDFTWETFASGEYFSQISEWYADTFPFRESLLTADSRIKGFYGIKGEELYGSVSVADKIPEPGDTPKVQDTKKAREEVIPAMKMASLPEEKVTDTQEESEEPKDVPKEDEEDEDADIQIEKEAAGSIYIVNKQGFELYYFNQESSDAYASVIGEAAEKLQGTADVYNILAPTSIGPCLPNKVQEELSCSPQDKAIDYVYSQMGENVKKISLFNTLKKHKDEYIYFHTDHHWTALGAYYAYQEFAKSKGIEPKSLDDYETMEFDGFVGSFYSSSNQSETLKNNPDSIVAYVPSGTNLITIEEEGGGELSWNVVYDVSGYNFGAKYSCFIGGDNPYSRIDNPAVTDGSSCLVVKDSYGNAFVPFLVDHYQTVHVVDYRSFKDGLVTFVKENGVEDVIFLNNLSSLTVKGAQVIQNILR